MQERRIAHYSSLDTTKQEKRPSNIQPPSVRYVVDHLVHMPKQTTVKRWLRGPLLHHFPACLWNSSDEVSANQSEPRLKGLSGLCTFFEKD